VQDTRTYSHSEHSWVCGSGTAARAGDDVFVGLAAAGTAGLRLGVAPLRVMGITGQRGASAAARCALANVGADALTRV
jgi:hypothetical protein